MTLKKQHFKSDEVLIFDDAIIYKRGNYWHFRLWLEKERKYIRKSLQVKDKAAAIEKGRSYYLETQGNIKQGKAYFSKTAQEGVDLYLKHRQKDVVAKLIVPLRFKTIKNNLARWVDYIHKGTKLLELTRSSCEDYYHKRTEYGAALTTIHHEQTIINAMMKYLYRQGEAHIDGFDFKKLPRIDKGDESIKRATFKPEEIGEVEAAIHAYASEAFKDLNDSDNLKKYIISYYFLIAMSTGMRSGEQIQLRWSDIAFTEYKDKANEVSIIKIKVRAEISKVRKTRSFMVRDKGYLEDLRSVLWKKIKENEVLEKQEAEERGEEFKAIDLAGAIIFSSDGKQELEHNLIRYHFNKIIELSGIDTKNRKIVPYSFRHYFITNKIMSGLSYRQISDICGTSASQIESAYYHINEEIMRTNAMAGYKLSEGGLIETEAHEHFKD